MKALICFSLVCCASVFAQEVAQISGTVTDPSGAVVPNVDVAVSQSETGLKRTATSDSKGFYVIPNLPLGLTAWKRRRWGFRPLSALASYSR